MNKYLYNDVKGLEKNLNKLSHISKSKHSKELQSCMYEVMHPQKQICQSNIIDFHAIATKMAEQQSQKPSIEFSSLDTADGLYKNRLCSQTNVECHQSFVGMNDCQKNTENFPKVSRRKGHKKNILEEISVLDNSFCGDDHIYDTDSEDDKNYDELKNMITDMND